MNVLLVQPVAVPSPPLDFLYHQPLRQPHRFPIVARRLFMPVSPIGDHHRSRPVPSRRSSRESSIGAIAVAAPKAPAPPASPPSPRRDNSYSIKLPPLENVTARPPVGLRTPLTTLEPFAEATSPATQSATTYFPPVPAPPPHVLRSPVRRPSFGSRRPSIASRKDSIVSRSEVEAANQGLRKPFLPPSGPPSTTNSNPQLNEEAELPPSLQPISSQSSDRGIARDRSHSYASTTHLHSTTSAVASPSNKRRFEDDHTGAPYDTLTRRPSLLNRTRTEAEPRLKIRQQPKACRACGFGERDRRVIDPPPILALDESDDDTPTAPVEVIHVSLWDESGETDVTHAQASNRKLGGNLMGNSVASCIHGTDEHGRPGKFFVFTDLSCRAYGKYRLRFSLVKIPQGRAPPGTTAPIVSHIMSDVFTVYSAKDFPGMRPSSGLARALKEQGHDIPLKKGKRSGLSMPGEDESDLEEEERPAKRRRK